MKANRRHKRQARGRAYARGANSMALSLWWGLHFGNAIIVITPPAKTSSGAAPHANLVPWLHVAFFFTVPTPCVEEPSSDLID